MSTSKTPLAERAEALTKHLDHVDQAQVLAMLALAEAVQEVAAELRDLGAEAYPVHVREA